MSELQGSTNDFINQLVVKAIEKKKKNEQILANKLKPRLEHVLFSQFDVLETIESHNQKTTLYRLSKKGEPDKQICCKVLNEDQPDYIHDMFLAEATHLEISQHPSIVEFIKLGNEFERPYFMYRWVEGETVAEKLTRFKHKNFRHDHIAWLVYQLSGALEYIHTRGICHLDIKPSNIIICEDDSVKLIDFGASQYINESNRYNEASLSYTSPLFIESGKANTQDDVYSLAVLTYALFTGFSDNNDWKAKLNQRKRPDNIPKSVWILLQQVIKKPRSHGFTPILFAQELACIDTDAMTVSHNVPLFNQLRNADLVLRKRDKHDSLRAGRFKLLESVLAFSVLLITVIFALKMLNHPIVDSVKNKPEDKASLSKFESSSNINPAQVAAFLSQPPWVIESALNKASSNALVLVPYRKAVDVKNSQMRYWYLKQESLLEEQRKSQLTQLSDLSLLHKEMVSFRDYLKQMKYLSSGVDQRLVEMMATLNNLKLEHQNYNYSSMLGHEALAKSVILGEGKSAQEYMHNGWIKSQAEAYFYSYVLPKQVLNEILASVNAQAKANFYSKAILALDEAIKLYGNNLDFSAKRSELVIKRSEYILFGTVTGEKVFQHDKLMTSLKELQSEDPIRFKEVIEVLSGISVDLLSKSFQQGTSTNGALLIEKALAEYQTGNVI